MMLTWRYATIIGQILYELYIASDSNINGRISQSTVINEVTQVGQAFRGK